MSSTLAEAVKLVNFPVSKEECRSILNDGMSTKPCVDDSILVSLADNWSSTFASLAHIEKDARSSLPSKSL